MVEYLQIIAILDAYSFSHGINTVHHQAIASAQYPLISHAWDLHWHVAMIRSSPKKR
jgi:hypothetical protein